MEMKTNFNQGCLGFQPEVERLGLRFLEEEYGKEWWKKENKTVSLISADDDNFLVSELFELAKESAFALTTRLHAGLIAAIAGCAILPISYQPKVNDVFRSLGLDNIIKEADVLSGQVCAEDFDIEFKSLDQKRIEDNRLRISHVLAESISLT